MAEIEKQNIKFQCKKFIYNNRKLGLKFSSCTLEEQEWMLNYLWLGKRTIPYEMILRFDSLDIKPKQDFFCIKQFCSRLKCEIISKCIIMLPTDAETVKIFQNTLRGFSGANTCLAFD